ncbi:YciK family oxidoreductase [Parahaliea sp. F7430]|uniref:YciK family oxidoreductase n=1 Tax=Sediminihaliea albiluteola TaxID=2758564 RepID=A0A7W2TVV0_9GAMM|nr:YciK family oxidoreductase [Sediminihaliea albiluteola]MBA6412870.1 YciK family oxidoreductase [Sediminihaliea albiluteola]
MSQTFIPEQYQPASNLLEGKTILVTGAGDGIGRAAAESYAAHGATIILVGRTVAKLEAVYDAIEAASGAQPAIFPLDLASATEQQCQELAEALEQNFGQLDGLLHNASVLGERRPIESASYKAWQEVMQVNVNSQFLLTRYLLPLLQQAASASIIFTSSGVGRRGKAYWGAYAVSKFATEGFMQVLASELENTSKVRVNTINPGATNTAMRRAAYPAETPTDNPTPAEIMPLYLYLMGEDSAGVTGQAFNAQG